MKTTVFCRGWFYLFYHVANEQGLVYYLLYEGIDQFGHCGIAVQGPQEEWRSGYLGKHKTILETALLSGGYKEISSIFAGQ